MPPFLVDESEPGLGSYDVLDEPDRSWLLGLIRRFRVEAVFCGHTHFQTFNTVGTSRVHTTPSTTTTRPGFYEALSVAPPVRGWADTPKLGFFLVRALEEGLAVHLIRTSGRSTPPATAGEIVLTRVSQELPGSPLGAYLRLPLARHSDGAIAYPYQVRHRIRDDYPLLACLELGLRHVRFPIADLESSIQRDRLALLRDEGVALTASVIWARGRERRDVSQWAPEIDVLEIQLAGETVPNDDECRAIKEARSAGAVAPCPIVMEAGGTIHKRSRTGYRPAELDVLDEELLARGVRIDRAVCFVDTMSGSAWETILEFPRSGLRAIDGLDLILPLADEDGMDIAAIAEGILAASTIPGCRVFIDPLQELDRTATVMSGLLDRLSNPLPMFHLVRVLNTVLFANLTGPADYRAEQLSWQDRDIARGVSSRQVEHWLTTPERVADIAASLADREGKEIPVKFVDLVTGESRGPMPIGAVPRELAAWRVGLATISLTPRADTA
jgi:hypothetical protein